MMQSCQKSFQKVSSEIQIGFEKTTMLCVYIYIYVEALQLLQRLWFTAKHPQVHPSTHINHIVSINIEFFFNEGIEKNHHDLLRFRPYDYIGCLKRPKLFGFCHDVKCCSSTVFTWTLKPNIQGWITPCGTQGLCAMFLGYSGGRKEWNPLHRMYHGFSEIQYIYKKTHKQALVNLFSVCVCVCACFCGLGSCHKSEVDFQHIQNTS